MVPGDDSVGKTLPRWRQKFRLPETMWKTRAQWSTFSGQATKAGLGSSEQAAGQTRQNNELHVQWETLSPYIRESTTEEGTHTYAHTCAKKLPRKTKVGWQDGSAGKGTYCSSLTPAFQSQYPLKAGENSTKLSSDHTTHMPHTCTHNDCFNF